MSSDLNLLFGALAVQMNLVPQDALDRATNVWMQNKHRLIADILMEQRQLTPQQVGQINALVREKLRENDNDSQESMALMTATGAVPHARGDGGGGASQTKEDATGSFPHAQSDATSSTPQTMGDAGGVAPHTMGEAGHDDFQHTMTQAGGSPPATGWKPQSGTVGEGGTGSIPTPYHASGHATMHAGGSRKSAVQHEGTRFRVLRPHARGGLGEVFVAQDQEINREVALKEILSKHAVDADSRGRFLMEAEITGGLEHPGIVPVYGLGTYSDGRPYYAMRFIHGDSLKEAINHFYEKPISDESERNVAFRNLLKRFVDVCNAIGYAHSRGVLHRDLKPGNIMIGKYGETLVVDWGLAKTIGDTSPEQGGTLTGAEKSIQPSNAASVEATVAGTAIGTPAFMSPEQAEGRLDILGKSTDIYSLGATLYSLVTGQVPFNGKKIDELLSRVKRGEYTPPIKAKPGVPSALNAIVVKAMALKPEDRYVTAMALGEDIEHFLADEPVQAYPEPLIDRLRRWGRKHRSFMTAATVMLVTSVLALGVGLLFVNAEKNRTIRERNEKEAARAAEQEQREKAETARNSALDALDAMTSNFTRDSLIAQQEITPEQKKFLEEAHNHYLGLMKEAGNGENERKRRAQAAFRVGTIERRLGRNAEAETSFETAAGLFKELAADYPAQPEYRFEQARSFTNTGLVRHQAARYREATVSYTNAVNIQEALAGEFPQKPEYAQQWARTLTNLGDTWRVQGETEEANRVLKQAIAIQTKLAADHPKVPDYRNQLAGSLSNLAITMLERGRAADAEPLLQRTLEIREKLRTESPAEATYQEDLAKTRINLANTANALGNTADAVGELRKAVEIYETLQQTYPSMPQYQQYLSSANYLLAETLNRLKTVPPQEPLDTLRKALDSQKQLAGRFPKNPVYRSLLARSHNFLGNMLLARKQQAEAGNEYAEAINIQAKLVSDFPKNREYQAELALSHNNRGVFHRDGNQAIDAEKDFQAAYAIQQKLIEEFPAQVAYQLNQAMTCRNLGELKRGDTQLAEALPWYDKAVAFSDAVYAKTPDDIETLKQLKASLTARQKILEQQKEAPKAAADATRIVELDTSIRLKNAVNLIVGGRVADVMPAVEALAKRPDLKVRHHVELARIYALAAVRDKANDRKLADEAIGWLKKAVAGGFTNVQLLDKDPDFAMLRERDEFKQVFAGKN
ncbi:serine/threonine-protein kinase [Zavarzinella formosa]|uniref:serine/threonine-protein kinase n=1 Tax=Zavarzinella formosa TaxID=360055 RepID=UPI0002E9B7C2|nr:serine/threonine-protein kinase [Zavarzinella formosa]